jgi:hypothetical protein
MASSPRSWDVENSAMPAICSGTVDLERLGTIPRLEADSSPGGGPWSLAPLRSGLPCDYVVSKDGRQSVVLVLTGPRSQYVLFFKGDRLLRAQMIGGPWNLEIYGDEFPPRLSQMHEGAGGYLFSFDENTGYYRKDPYPYGSDDEE